MEDGKEWLGGCFKLQYLEHILLIRQFISVTDVSQLHFNFLTMSVNQTEVLFFPGHKKYISKKSCQSP